MNFESLVVPDVKANINSWVRGGLVQVEGWAFRVAISVGPLRARWCGTGLKTVFGWIPRLS